MKLRPLSYFGEKPYGNWESDVFDATGYIDHDTLRLDIVFKDGAGGRTWDDLMEVKRACGFGDNDAVEVFPADSDVINTGNVRHLYIYFDPFYLVRRGDLAGQWSQLPKTISLLGDV